jgi:peptidoglycan/xylan/chitin deacetylase (PgdA/CDA1 family)
MLQPIKAAISALFATSALNMAVIGVPMTQSPSNLIANPSVETVSATNKLLPQDWSKNKWGTNSTVFTYKSGATNDGARSLRVDVKSITSGDAKWVHKAVPVKPATTYTFSDSYKADVTTEYNVAYQLTNGTMQYNYVSLTPAVSTWTNKTIEFTTPANAKTVSVYHLIDKKGYLETDNTVLSPKHPTTPPIEVVPTITIISPANNATVAGIMNVAINAVNTIGVQYAVDGINYGSEITAVPYTTTIDTTKLTNGTHVLTATARSQSGNMAMKTQTFTVNNVVTPPAVPAVTLLTPANNAVVSGVVQLTARQENSAGVVYMLDDTVLCKLLVAAPYTCAWDTKTASNGPHTIKAVVYAKDGTTIAATSLVAVTVNNTAETKPPVLGSNLVSNSGIETADSNNAALPASWQHNAWGTNSATFAYPVGGYNSSKAVRTEVSAYTNGDAKWYFNPINVTPNTAYMFSDMYRANVASEVVIEQSDVYGNVSYAFPGSLPASQTWQKGSFVFTTGANTTKITLYHLISTVGWLEIDDVAVQTFAASADSANPIMNPSMEIMSGTQPLGWQAGSWGNNTAVFEYASDAHSGSKSGKVTLSNYADGDAKWMFEPTAKLTPGKQYRWSTWYKTNTLPQAVAMYIKADGTTSYFGMPKPYPANNSATTWTQYSETFTVPSDAVSVSVFMFINRNGWLQIDDQAITNYTPTPWNRPLVSLTFDDGYESNVTSALPVMERYGFDSTQCYEIMDLRRNPAVNDETVRTFYRAGHELCSHTINHGFLTKLTPTQVDEELRVSKDYIQNIIGAPITGFASPYGDYNQAVNSQIMQYYGWHRTVDEGFNSKDNLDRYRLRVQNITPATKLSQYQAWLDQAQRDKTWLIFVYHDVVDSNPSPYGSYRPDFEQQMAALKASGITVKPVSAALSEVAAQ